MALYNNRTPHSSIVTVLVTMAPQPEKALKIGANSGAMVAISADGGIHDFVVGPGEMIELSQGVEATVLGVRNNR